MTSLLGVLEGLWTHVGAGLLLAFALPLFLVVLGAIAVESRSRRLERSGSD